MPKVAKTGNFAQDETNVVVRNTLMKLIHHLQSQPNEVLLTWTRLSTAEAPQAASEADHWDRTVTNVKKLPKAWKAQWLIKNDTSENRPFTKPLLDKMDAKQAGAVEKVFNVVLFIVDVTPVTPTMREDK